MRVPEPYLAWRLLSACSSSPMYWKRSDCWWCWTVTADPVRGAALCSTLWNGALQLENIQIHQEGWNKSSDESVCFFFFSWKSCLIVSNTLGLRREHICILFTLVFFLPERWMRTRQNRWQIIYWRQQPMLVILAKNSRINFQKVASALHKNKVRWTKLLVYRKSNASASQVLHP